jgi:hypothetical protein
MEINALFVVGIALVFFALMVALIPKYPKCPKCGKYIKSEADTLVHWHIMPQPSLTPQEAPELYALFR